MTHKPAAPTSAFFWQGQPSVIGASLRKPTTNLRTWPKDSQNAKGQKYSPPVIGRAAEQRARDKRAALLRGGI